MKLNACTATMSKWYPTTETSIWHSAKYLPTQCVVTIIFTEFSKAFSLELKDTDNKTKLISDQKSKLNPIGTDIQGDASENGRKDDKGWNKIK